MTFWTNWERKKNIANIAAGTIIIAMNAVAPGAVGEDPQRQQRVLDAFARS